MCRVVGMVISVPEYAVVPHCPANHKLQLERKQFVESVLEKTVSHEAGLIATSAPPLTNEFVTSVKVPGPRVAEQSTVVKAIVHTSKSIS